MPDPNDNLIHRWFEEVWNKSRIEAIDEMLDPDCVVHGIADQDGNPVKGSAGFKLFFKGFNRSFPGLRVTVEDTLVQGDKIAARCRVKAAHSATQKPIDFTGMCIARVKDGKIVEAWNNFDFMAMYQQMGVLPAL